MKKILFCGDSAVGGAANYLLGVLGTLPVQVTHIAPDKPLSARILKTEYDAILLSDYSKSQVSIAMEKKIATQVEKKGCGLMMIGGWGSFSGPFGGWKGGVIEKLLPVRCSAGDDRTNFPGGAHVVVDRDHPALGKLSFKHPPAICGMNAVKVLKSSTTVLSAKKIVSVGSHLTLDPAAHPLLVVDSNPERRVAAYTSDFAPHWCGGFVDWGGNSKVLKIGKKYQVEVGESYIGFIQSLMNWLMRK